MDSEIEYDFKTGDELSDVKLVVEDQILYVHKAILGTCSPVFKKMLTLNFREKTHSEIKLPGKKLHIVLELLKLIYPNFPKCLNKSNLEDLLELSEEYLINSVKNSIEKEMIKNLNDSSAKKLYGKAIDCQIKEVVYLINISLQYRLNKLKEECVNYLSSNFSKKQLESALKELNNDTIRIEIYEKKIDLLEEKLSKKLQEIKKLNDENLKQKYELKKNLV